MVSHRRRKTILFFPLNSPGHINSSLGIADRIKQEYGHRTVFLVLGKMMSNCVRDHGHELVMLDEVDVYEDYEIEEGEDPSELNEELKRAQGKQKRTFEGALKWPQILMRNQNILRLDPVEAFIGSCEMLEKLMLGEIMANHDNYAAAIESIKPDMIIVDAYYVPPCVVNLKHIPWVRLYSANPLALLKSKLSNDSKPAPMIGFKLYDRRERDRLRREEPDKWQSMLTEWEETNKRIASALMNVGGVLNDFMTKHGCDPLPPGKQAHDSPHLNIYMFPEALDYDKDDDLFEYPPRWFRSDSLVRSNKRTLIDPEVERHNEMWINKLTVAARDKTAKVLFSLGSLASGNVALMRRYVDMLKQDEQRLYVVSKGVNGDKFELNESNMIGGKYIPQTLVLQHVNLAIIHGGNNSVTESMYYGLPMIVLPVFADQLDNAQRVEDLGYGRRLDVYRCTEEQLLKAVDELLADTALIKRMRNIGLAMRNGNDLAKISLMLNKLVTQKSLEQEFIEECRRSPIDEIKF